MKRGGGREGGVGCVVGEMECSVPKGGSGWRVWWLDVEHQKMSFAWSHMTSSMMSLHNHDVMMTSSCNAVLTQVKTMHSHMSHTKFLGSNA